MMHGIDGDLDVVAYDTGASAARRHRASIRIGQRYLLVRRSERPQLECKEPLHLLFQLRDLLLQAGRLGRARQRRPLPMGAVELVQIAGDALNLTNPPGHLGAHEFLSRLFTALNLLPSIATPASVNRPTVRQSAANRAQTWRMARPLSLRKSAIVL